MEVRGMVVVDWAAWVMEVQEMVAWVKEVQGMVEVG
jgi:hypothetical protein